MLFLLLMLVMFKTNYGQNDLKHQIEFGIDLTTIIIWASGGNRPYSEFEFIYRETYEKKDLRFKLGINSYNYYGKELILGKQIEDNKPISLKYLQVTYSPKLNYIASIGLSKYLKENVLPIYYGMDVNLGISRGRISTNIREIMLGEENKVTVSNRDNNLLVLGITPVIGLKKHITDKILFGIEFGIHLNSVLGNIEYIDENQEIVKESANHFELGLDRIINGITLLDLLRRS